jgi:hypothetical protein
LNRVNIASLICGSWYRYFGRHGREPHFEARFVVPQDKERRECGHACEIVADCAAKELMLDVELNYMGYLTCIKIGRGDVSWRADGQDDGGRNSKSFL